MRGPSSSLQPEMAGESESPSPFTKNLSPMCGSRSVVELSQRTLERAHLSASVALTAALCAKSCQRWIWVDRCEIQ